LLQDSQQGLGSAASHVEGLQASVNSLNKELTEVRMELTSVNRQYTTLQADYEKLLTLRESSLKEADQRLSNELQKLTHDLNNRWKAVLKQETDKLKAELLQQKETENQVMLQRLTSLKDAELLTVKQGWEHKVNQLLQEISELKQHLTAAESHASETSEQMMRQHEMEIQRLRSEMLEAAQQYSDKVHQLESLNREQIETLTSKHSQILMEKEEEFRQQNMADLKTQLMAHKVAVESLRDELEKSKSDELEMLKNQCEQDMESLRNELELRFAEEMEQTTFSHTQRLQAAKMELDRAVELSRQKESEHSIRVSDLEEKVAYRDKLITELKGERSHLQRGLDEMSKELEAKVKEILHVRSEANHALRARETELEHKFQSDLANAEADYLQKTQDILTEFGRAQQLLKDKIVQLQHMLEDAEYRYQNRESRDEDLETIGRLRMTIREQELAMNQLVEEKRYFQMELVNRETNFNKVFNSDPKVGILNPLSVSKKPRPKEPPILSRHLSGGSSGSSRLEPLPGSPLHDEKFNTLKPIPPMKKILK
jgi:chromosome segregation ATPase